MKFSKSVLLLASALATGVVVFACSGDDDNSTPKTDAGPGTSPTSTPTSTPTGTATSTTDSGPPKGGGDDAATEAGTTTTLFERLGGHDGISYAVTAAIGQIMMDPTEATYFHVFDINGALDPNHRPTGDELVECFTRLIGANAGGTFDDGGAYAYPADISMMGVDGGNADGTYTCKDMVTVHAKLDITGPVFDNFVTIVANTLIGAEGATASFNGGPSFTYSFTTADVQALGGVLVSTKAQVVDAGAPDAYVCHDGGYCTDAGADAGPH